MGFWYDYSLSISIGSWMMLFICAMILFFGIPAQIREAEKKSGSVQHDDLTNINISIRVMVGLIFLGSMGILTQTTC
jgi:hypothetical protein